jgi:hypothetical protein
MKKIVKERFMNYMKEILYQVKVRPGAFLNDVTLENLYAFMNGCMYQIFQKEDIVPEFYPGFQEYIEEIYNTNTKQHWTKMIDFYSENKKAVVEKFFEHLEKYTEIEESNRKFQ